MKKIIKEKIGKYCAWTGIILLFISSNFISFLLNYLFGLNILSIEKYTFLILGISFGLLSPRFILDAIEGDITYGRFTSSDWRMVIILVVFSIFFILIFFDVF